MIAVTVAAGPLNYVGVNPKVSFKTPHPADDAPPPGTSGIRQRAVQELPDISGN
jgi:hypothetical protein